MLSGKRRSRGRGLAPSPGSLSLRQPPCRSGSSLPHEEDLLAKQLIQMLQKREVVPSTTPYTDQDQLLRKDHQTRKDEAETVLRCTSTPAQMNGNPGVGGALIWIRRDQDGAKRVTGAGLGPQEHICHVVL